MPDNPYHEHNRTVIDRFRADGGQVPGFGRALVLLHHVGARTGEGRVTPLRGIRTDADTWLIAASKAGAPDNPAWFHNLLAHPEAEIETAEDGTVAVHAEQLHGSERDAGWQLFLQASDGFRQYEQRTTRVIPVIALHRR